MNSDSFVLKVNGKAESPEPLKIGHNFRVVLEGSIVSETKSDNDDGSYTHYYQFRPIKIELIEEKGEAIKMKDTRSASQLFRARLWKSWQNAESTLSFDDWYQKFMLKLIQNSDEIVEMYKP